MNTKIKILIGCLCFFLSYGAVNAAWYGDHWMGIRNGTTWCDLDKQLDTVSPNSEYYGPYPGDMPSPYAQYYTQSRVINRSGTLMLCQYWDATVPVVSNNYRYNGIWINGSSQSIVLLASDYGGSGLRDVRWCKDAPCTPNIVGTNITINADYNGVVYYQASDVAGNQSAIQGISIKIDNTKPITSNLTYANASTNGWQNRSAINLSWNAFDGGGSGLKNYDIRVYSSNTPQNPVWGSPVTISTPTAATSYQYIGKNGYAYKFEICPRDNAGNVCTSWTTSTDIARIDTTPPDSALIQDTTAPNILATNNQTFSLIYNDNGAPAKIWYRFENNINPGLTDSLTTPDPYKFNYTYDRDISLVDNDRGSNGGRQIDIYIDSLCDQAGNCTYLQNPRIISHYIYANPNDNPTVSSSSKGTGIADGTQNIITQTIKDGYGNQIIPASGIGRTISMNLSNIVNTMYLDQYNRSGPTSVFIGNTTTPLITTGTQSFGAQSSTDGSYSLILYVYTPTASGYGSTDPVSDPDARIGGNQNITITDSIGVNKTLSQSLGNPVFRPLYTTAFIGDLRDGGFIEGALQTSQISVIKNPSTGVNVSGGDLQLQFAGSNASNFSMRLTSPVFATLSATRTSVGGLGGINPLLSTLFQKSGVTVDTLSNLILSSHITYTLDGKSIIINSDVIGKIGGYFGETFNAGVQQSVKIIGMIGSNALKALTTNQFGANGIFSSISPTTIRNELRKSLTIATRNMSLTTVGNTLTSLDSLPVNGSSFQGGIIKNTNTSSIMSLKSTGGNIVLTNGRISGKRTLVIQGGNLYITSNMYYADANSLLGVVLQKDANGNGGNLYIDPSVTNVVGSYIIDGSIMSYNGTTEIGFGNIVTLKNQLYIYGSIISENTIGGSRDTPIKCPDYLKITNCDLQTAQKYDLNYLRRYYLYGTSPIKDPFGGAKIIGGGTCKNGTCAGFDPNLAKKFTSTSEDLAQYPLIIEYDPRIGTNPPIGFVPE